MTKQAWLDVLGAQRLPQERVRLQIDLPDRQVVGRTKVGVQRAQVFNHSNAPQVGDLGARQVFLQCEPAKSGGAVGDSGSKPSCRSWSAAAGSSTYSKRP